MIDRKEFLKLSCTSCLLGAAAMMLPGITGCSPTATNIFKTEIADKKIVVPLQLFETAKLQVVRPKGWLYDIAVQKQDDGNFTALLLQCTHFDNQLTTVQNGFYCSLHGSRFNADGGVVKGPAENALKQFKTTKDNSNLTILV